MMRMQRRSLVGIAATVSVVVACNGSTAAISHNQSPNPSVPPTPSVPTDLADFVPPGAPEEDIQYFNEWPSPNAGLYNTRVAHSSISAANVASLKVAWSVPLTATGSAGRDFANPVVANGVVYLEDGASNVTAVDGATGRVMWKH